MIEGLRVLVVIPARGGSKRLPRKNLLPLLGKPLIEWTIGAAIDSGVADRIVVSSDDDEILATSAKYNVALMKRSVELSSDTASTVDVVLDVVRRLEVDGEFFDVVLLLQVTSPLRQAGDIKGGLKLYLSSNRKCVVSVCETDHPIQWCGTIAEDNRLIGFDVISGLRSQDFNQSYRLNGALYISDVEFIKREKSFYSGSTLGYVMSRLNSIDVDTEMDFLICNALAERFLVG